jgi:hypothetical protein
MAGAIERVEFLLLFKLSWFGLVCLCVYVFGFILARAYFLIGIWVVG